MRSHLTCRKLTLNFKWKQLGNLCLSSKHLYQKYTYFKVLHIFLSTFLFSLIWYDFHSDICWLSCFHRNHKCGLHVLPISIDLMGDLIHNSQITDSDNNFKYKVFYKTYFPSYLIVNSIATFLLIYNITQFSNSFLLHKACKTAFENISSKSWSSKNV